jgi:hypothetical protein
MPESRTLASQEVERNFLFAALAFQLELLSRSRLDQAWQTWTSQRVLPLPDLLRQRGWLGALEQSEVERVLARKLARHGGDLHLCLEELVGGADRDYLAGLAPSGLLGQRGTTGNGSVAVRNSQGAERDRSTNEAVRDPDLVRPGRRRFLPNQKILARLTTAVALILLLVLGASLLGPTLMERFWARGETDGEAADSFSNIKLDPFKIAAPQSIRIMKNEFRRAAARTRPLSESDRIRYYEDQIVRAHNALTHGIMGELKDALTHCLPTPADKVDSRGPEWYLLWRQYQSREHLLISPEQTGNGFETRPLTQVAFAHSGKAIALTGFDGRIRIWDPKKETQLQSIAIEVNKPITDSVGVAFSKDDRVVACGRENGELAFFEVATGKLVQLINTELEKLGSFAWSPDNQRIVAASASVIKIFNHPAGKVMAQMTVFANDGAAKIVDLAYSPSGNSFAVAGTDGLVRLYDAATGKASGSFDFQMPRKEAHLHRLAFSPDGKFLAVAGEGTKISVREKASGKELRLLEGLNGPVNGIAYSPDGRRIAGVCFTGQLNIWSAYSGRLLYSLVTIPLNSIVLSPDGERMVGVGTGRAVKVWDVSRLEPDQVVERSAEQIAEELLAMHPDRLELIDHLRKDAKLNEPIRQAVLRRIGPQLALELNDHSWKSVAQNANASSEDCRRAVREAEAACRLMPGDGNYLNTLGVVQYRAKQYDKALATMLRSTQINRGKEFFAQAGAAVTYLPGPHYSDLAFVAMCYAQKGQSNEAKKWLEELEKLMESTAWKDNGEAQMFLAESRKLIVGQARAGLPH